MNLNRTVTTTAAADHHRRLLELRDKLTVELDTAPPAYIAGISRQLQNVLTELAAMPDPDAPASPLEALAARGRARRAAAGIADPPSRLTAVVKPGA